MLKVLSSLDVHSHVSFTFQCQDKTKYIAKVGDSLSLLFNEQMKKKVILIHSMNEAERVRRDSGILMWPTGVQKIAHTKI